MPGAVLHILPRLLLLLSLLQHAVALTSCFAGIHAPATAAFRRAAVTCEADSAPALSGRQKRQLRSHAGRLAMSKQLRSIIVSDPKRSAGDLSAQLEANELVRARFPEVGKKAEAKQLAAELAELTSSSVAEVLGHTALLYRPSARKLIELDPPASSAG